MDALWTCIKVVYLVVSLWTRYGHITDMCSSSIPSCVIMDTLWTCIIVVYLVVPLWTRYGHIMDMYYSSITSCVIMDTLWTHYGDVL